LPAVVADDVAPGPAVGLAVLDAVEPRAHPFGVRRAPGRPAVAVGVDRYLEVQVRDAVRGRAVLADPPDRLSLRDPLADLDGA
jgi:hypothetical protein